MSADVRHHGLRRAGILAQVLAAVVVVVIALTVPAPWLVAAPGSVVVSILLVGWCVAGPVLFAAATRLPRSSQELALAFALVGLSPVLLIAAAYGVSRLGGLV